MGAGDPSQITDVGLGSSKGDIENLADVGGVSLGFEGDAPAKPNPNIVAPAQPQTLGLGSVGEYLANSPTQGNIASSGLPFGMGDPTPLPQVDPNTQTYIDETNKALHIFENSKIPLARFTAAKRIQHLIREKYQENIDDDR